MLVGERNTMIEDLPSEFFFLGQHLYLQAEQPRAL